MVIFNSLTVHRGMPNRSDQVRLSVDFRYQPRSEPMYEINLEPHRGVAEWDELYAGWTREEIKYYWKAHDLEVVPFDMQYYEPRDAMAFDMAARGDGWAKSALQRIVSNDPDGDKRARPSRPGGAGGRSGLSLAGARPAPREGGGRKEARGPWQR